MGAGLPSGRPSPPPVAAPQAAPSRGPLRSRQLLWGPRRCSVGVTCATLSAGKSLSLQGNFLPPAQLLRPPFNRCFWPFCWPLLFGPYFRPRLFATVLASAGVAFAPIRAPEQAPNQTATEHHLSYQQHHPMTSEACAIWSVTKFGVNHNRASASIGKEAGSRRY